MLDFQIARSGRSAWKDDEDDEEEEGKQSQDTCTSSHSMKSFLFFLVITAILFISAAFQTRRLGASSKFLSMARSRAGVNIALPAEEQDTFVPGKDIPQEVANLQSIYDMILVERLHEPEKTTGGLFLPKTEGRDQKHLGVVLSMPTYGLESENGLLNPIEAIAPFAVGDTVFIRVSTICPPHNPRLVLLSH